MLDSCLEVLGDKYARIESGPRCICFSVCISVMAILVWIAVGLEGVEPTEYAITKHNFSQMIGQETVYDGGLKWVGISYSLIRYPATEVTMEFSDHPKRTDTKLNTRTKEGLNLSLQFAIQYKFRRQMLPKMYRLVENDYKKLFSRVARNAILQVASTYPAKTYWTDRKMIGNHMKGNLTEQFNKLHIDIEGFALLQINLPRIYENAIITTQVTKQEELTYTNIRAVGKAQQEIKNIEAAGGRAVQKLISKNQSDATITLNKAEGEIQQTTITQTAAGLKAIQDKLKFKNPKTSLIDYFYVQKINGLSENTSNKLICGVPNVTMKQ